MAKSVTPKEIPHYTVTFSGTCIVKNESGTGSIVKAFRPITLKFDSLDPFKEIKRHEVGFDHEKNQPILEETHIVNIQGVMKREFGHRALARIPGFVRIRTIGIDAVEAHNGAPWHEIPPRFLSRRLLEQYIEKNDIPLDPATVPDTCRLRSLVMCFLEDPTTFFRRLKELKVRLSHEDAYKDLNADMPDPVLEDVALPNGVSRINTTAKGKTDGAAQTDLI